MCHNYSHIQRAETCTHLLQQNYEFFDLETFCRRKRNLSHEKHLKKFNTGCEKHKLIEIIIGIVYDLFSGLNKGCRAYIKERRSILEYTLVTLSKIDKFYD